MEIRIQKVLIRLLGNHVLGEMFPMADNGSKLWTTDGDAIYCKDDHDGWYCSRPVDHDGPHIRHNILGLDDHRLPAVWINKKGSAK